MITKTFLACAVAVLALSGVALADIAAGLSPIQLQQIKDGQMIVAQKDMPGGVWPQLTVYTLVNAPVATVAGVFRDYDHAQDFQPNLVSAKVVSQPAPNVCVVEYTSRMPIFGTMSYTVQNTYSQSGGGVDVQWKLLKSPMADISDGSLRVEPFGTGSILRYTNYVKPKSSIAILAKGAAQGEVKNTVAALKAEAEKRAKSK
ncbi:MAG: SRPBCC family protein [Terrimicrobiaceae bacterium]|nr:SRPBCC family protein [Terrimicrobiaceae bacterium]